MKKLLTERFAVNGLLIIISLTIIFHLLVLFGIIPFEIVWGGRLKDQSQMLIFETVSLAINLLMLAVVLIKADLISVRINKKVIRIFLWIMFGLFLLNTIGNIFSDNDFEKIVFTPLTLLLSIFSLRLAVEN